MVFITTTFELTEHQLEALKFEAEQQDLRKEELVGCIVRQNIPPLLEVIETKDERRRQDLVEALTNE